VPFPSSDILVEAAADLAGSHPLTIVTIPALLHAARSEQDAIIHSLPPIIQAFGTKQEKPVLEAFQLRYGVKKPYLAVWQEAPSFIRDDYPGSTLQRLRTQDLLGQDLFQIAWNEDHSRRIGTALRPTAGAALAARRIKPVNRLSLALWLARHEDLSHLESYLDWFDGEYPLNGTDLEDFYPRAVPEYAEEYHTVSSPRWSRHYPAPNEELINKIQPALIDAEALDMPSTTPPKTVPTSAEPDSEESPSDDDLGWTRDICGYPLRSADIGRIVDKILSQLEEQRIVLLDARSLVTRCVSALLVGHLVLQGPPGTGKTTLARILANAFDVRLLESTATSEWSPFHVVGGLRPSSDNTLKPSYGKVADAALKCAIHVRANVNAEAEGSDDAPAEQARRWQGAWLLIDEFNRADIDKAIGSLYTVLSSCDASNLERSPIDLWFEEEGRQQLWVPSRFRIIAAMNDLDTSFVNPISQGLTRRFQFITIGVPNAPESAAEVTEEVQNTLAIAYEWLSSTYGGVLTLEPLDTISIRIRPQIMVFQQAIQGLRTSSEDGAGWPVGTAQVVDVFRILLLQIANGIEAARALDWAVADRLVPQMGQLDDRQLQQADELFQRSGLANAQQALQHVQDPHGLL
jgi:MoxR-like ATPase